MSNIKKYLSAKPKDRNYKDGVDLLKKSKVKIKAARKKLIIDELKKEEASLLAIQLLDIFLRKALRIEEQQNKTEAKSAIVVEKNNDEVIDDNDDDGDGAKKKHTSKKKDK